VGDQVKRPLLEALHIEGGDDRRMESPWTHHRCVRRTGD
jgi:hypothetical protein